jgi:mono/diheme cytochrome c family protein
MDGYETVGISREYPRFTFLRQWSPSSRVATPQCSPRILIRGRVSGRSAPALKDGGYSTASLRDAAFKCGERSSSGLGWALLGIVLSAIGCADPVADARAQQARGQTAYTTYCASCHEIEQGIGPRLKREVLATRLNAATLLAYNRRNMPYQAGNTLLYEQYVDITAYLLVRGGFLDSSRVFTELTAADIQLGNVSP